MITKRALVGISWKSTRSLTSKMKVEANSAAASLISCRGKRKRTAMVTTDHAADNKNQIKYASEFVPADLVEQPFLRK